MGISLCMITKNEEENLPSCLNSVKDLVSEIIVVDTGSTDNTKKVAKEFGAQIHDFEWVDDFSAARNFGIEKAKEDWVLVLDADEVLGKENIEKIQKLTERDDCDGFSLEQCSYTKDPMPGCARNNLEYEAGKEYEYIVKKNLVRLFRNKKGIAFEHRIHEVVEDNMREQNLPFEKTNIKIHHMGSAKGDEVTNEKKEFYGNLILQQLDDDPNSARYNFYAARYYMSIADFDKAMRFFKKTATINPKYKLIYSEIAKIYMKHNDLDSAIKNFRKSWELNSDNPSPANNLAVLLMHKQEFSEAKEILETQMKRNPNNNALKINYQQLLKEMNQNKRNIAG